MDDDFGLAEEANGKKGGTDPARGVATHGVMLPGAGFIGAWAATMGDDRFSAWEADLPAVRMAAEVEVHSSCEGFGNDFRRMHQKDADGI